jgi:hypothetical protein
MTQTPQEIALEAAAEVLGQAYGSPNLYNYRTAKVLIETYHAKLLELGAAKKGVGNIIGNPNTTGIWSCATDIPCGTFPVLIIKTDSNKS